MQRFSLLILFALGFSISIARARADDAPRKLYDSLEADARVELREADSNFDAEIERRAKAGQARPTPAELAVIRKGVRFFVYNKVVGVVLCADVTARAKGGEAELNACTKRHREELTKFYKLSAYVVSLGRKGSICEMKNRLFDEELRFPPFAFLADQDGQALFDFMALNKCLME